MQTAGCGISSSIDQQVTGRELRREGDVLGAVQSGRRSGLKLLSLLRDEDLIVAARQAAAQLIGADPELTEHPELARLAVDLLDDQRAEYLHKV